MSDRRPRQVTTSGTRRRRVGVVVLALGLLATGCVDRPAVVAELHGASAISGNQRHACAIETGSVRCWGSNLYGQLGDGTTEDSWRSSVQVGEVAGATSIAAGVDFSCAIVEEGDVRCWGFNLSGQVGDGSTFGLADARATVPDVEHATAIAAGDDHACATVGGGAVKCWGGNHFGQLGDGTTDDSTAAVDVEGIDGAVALSSGTGFTCAVISGGSVECWGLNSLGQLGDGGYSDRLTPAPVGGITDAIDIHSGLASTCVLHRSASVSCWGSNDSGQLGDGTTVDRSTPTAVRGVAGVSALAVGERSTCVTASGALVCWGGDALADHTRFPTADDVVDVALLGLDPCAIVAAGVVRCGHIGDPRSLS